MLIDDGNVWWHMQFLQWVSVPTIFINILGIQYFATDNFLRKKVKICPREKKGLRREKQNHWNGKWCYSSHLYFSVEKALIAKGCAVFWVLAILVLRLRQLVWLASIGICTSIGRPPWFCQNKFHNLP